MARQKREVSKQNVYPYLSAAWKDTGAGFSEINGHYECQLGVVAVFGQRAPEGTPFIRYEFIHNGSMYDMYEQVNRTERGICCVASRFARDVVNGRYE